MTKYRDLAEKDGLSEIVELANIGQFALILQYDLWILGSDCEATKSNWRRTLNCRHLCTILFESLEDLSGLCGKFVRLSLPKLATLEIQRRLRDAQKDLSVFKRAHSSLLKVVRNIISSHRDHDAMNQLATMQQMDIERILNLNADYIHWLDDLLRIIDDTIIHIRDQLTKWRKGGTAAS